MTGDNLVAVASTSVDATAAGALIAESFADLAAAQWLVADRAERVRILAAQFEMFVSHAVKHGAVHTIDDDAVAVWFDNTYDAPWIDRYDERVAALVGELSPRFAAFDATLAQHHPHNRPHHHLALLAVRPGRQGEGLGGRLLSHHQRLLDQYGIGAFLEASSLSSRALYLRNGFEPFGEHPYHLPESGPPMWPMWRPPATGAESS